MKFIQSSRSDENKVCEKQNLKKKSEGENRLGRGPKFSHGELCSSNVNLGFKLGV